MGRTGFHARGHVPGQGLMIPVIHDGRELVGPDRLPVQREVREARAEILHELAALSSTSRSSAPVGASPR
jgi:hypothetical protein